MFVSSTRKQVGTRNREIRPFNSNDLIPLRFRASLLGQAADASHIGSASQCCFAVLEHIWESRMASIVSSVPESAMAVFCTQQPCMRRQAWGCCCAAHTPSDST